MGIIKTKELSKLGYTDNVARSLAIELTSKHCKHYTLEETKDILRDIHEHPDNYKNDKTWGKLAEAISPSKSSVSSFELREEPMPYYIITVR